MSKQSQISRIVTLFASLVLVIITGWMVIGKSPHRHEPAAEMHRRPGDRVAAPNQFEPRMLPPEPMPTLLADSAVPFSADGSLARYDRLVVEVQRDGTLRVLGEQMEVDTFRDMLDQHLGELAPTIVTIQPDDECIFRHVGPVISVCEEAGILHTTLPRSSRNPRLPGGPA